MLSIESGRLSHVACSALIIHLYRTHADLLGYLSHTRASSMSFARGGDVIQQMRDSLSCMTYVTPT